MFEPRIVCFFCKWCTYAGADLAGTSRKQYSPNGVVVRVNCSGRIDPQHILWAFREGADGVLVGGCHPGDCHYQDGNYKTMRRVAFLKRMLEDMGVDPKRLHLEWISAAEGDKLVHVMNDFVDAVKEMGPMGVDLAGDGEPQATPPASPKKKAVAKAKAKPGTKAKAKAKARPKKKVAAKPKPRKKAVKKAKAKPKKKVIRKVSARPKKKTTKKSVARPKKKVAAKPKPRKKTARKATRKITKRAVRKSGRKTAKKKSR
ncbi:MAG: hydrogenase iron-sulfur subunit [Candidatus Eisenbacteria bacterium]